MIQHSRTGKIFSTFMFITKLITKYIAFVAAGAGICLLAFACANQISPAGEPIYDLSEAIEKTRDLTVYRVEFESSATGGGAPAHTLFSGAFNGEESEFSFAEDYSVALGLEPEQAVEIINTSESAYVYGPVPRWGVPDARWYSLPGESLPSPVNWKVILENLGALDMGQTNFSTSSADPIDDAACTIYSADQAGVIRLINGINGVSNAAEESASEFLTFRESYFKLWVCEDGYLHQIDTSMGVTDQAGADFMFKLKLHLYDLDGAIQITPPPDAMQSGGD